jgi:hypothetical protein
MTGEFKMQLRNYDQAQLTTLFNKAYQNSLPQAYAKSSYKDGAMFSQDMFCAGSLMDGDLLLIYMLQADTLRCYVETEATQDLAAMKKAINMYFQQIIRILDRNKIKWHNPEATIKLEKYRSYGDVKTLVKRVRAIFEGQWEKLILTPVASLLASYLAIQFHILSMDESLKDAKKAVTLTMEAYIGLVVILIAQVLFKANKKEFTFNV